MQKPPSQLPAGVNRPMPATNPDRADCRNPEPRDPVGHPHFSVRPPLARRFMAILAAEAENQPKHESQ